jgi:hypothetical protein
MAKTSTSFKPGQGGRKLGSKGKFASTVKETVLSVFQGLQDDPKANLEWFAKKYPRDFYQIAAKLIPTELTGSLKHVINVTEPDDK